MMDQYPNAGCPQQGREAPPAGRPAYPPPAYFAPPFQLRPPRDLRHTGAVKTFNRLCLVVLFQTAAAFAFELLAMVLSALAGVNVLEDDVGFQLMLTALVPLSTALPFLVYMKIGRTPAADFLRFERVGFLTALAAVLAGLCLCLLGNFPAIGVQSFFEQFGYEAVPSITGDSDSLKMFWLELLSTAVLVPVMEEFAFRGVLFSALRRHGECFAIVGSTLVFSLVHLDFSNVLFAFIAGLVFAFLYSRTENLWISTAIHMLNNGIAVVGSYGKLLFGSGQELADLLLFVLPIAAGLPALIVLLIRKRKTWFLPGWKPAVFAPLSLGEGLKVIGCSPLFWVLMAMMAAYTTSLFF